VLFADLKGSMELLADRDPEEARKLLDPVLEHMMEAVHRYEGTVNQVMGDGIMALFGAPLAHEDHAVRACYAALRMQEAVRRYSDELRRGQGVEVQIRVGVNSGDVVVRSIGSDLRMDYTAVGHTTHLAARMEQFASPGSILLTPATLNLVEGYVAVNALGPVPVKGLVEAVECCGLGRYPSAMLWNQRVRVVELASRSRLPTVYPEREYAEAGGLMSYGPNVPANFYRAATYVDKILKGAKPGDLPIQQPTEFELVINRKTATALDLTIPPSLLQRADEVIQ
jgi:class 3 adenylate cyclase